MAAGTEDELSTLVKTFSRFRMEISAEKPQLIINGEEETSAKIKVVHNYGHGGSGVTLHWGCAKEVAEVIKREQTQGREKLSKL